jgi:hypothetical protein
VSGLHENTTIEHQGGLFTFTNGVHVLTFDRLNPRGDSLRAWYELRSTEPPQLLGASSVDLTGSRTVTTIAKPIGDEQWIRDAVYHAVTETFKGDPPRRLVDIPELSGPRWLLPPLILGAQGTSIIAPGGSMKSMFALAAAATVASGTRQYLPHTPAKTGPVLYCDWEADADTHRERVAAMGPVPTDLHYLDMKGRPLWRSADMLEKFCVIEGVVMVVIDSVMLARGGDAFGPEETLRMFGALKQMGPPHLLIDHVSKDGKRKNQGPYGSVVNENTARLQWDLTKSPLPDGAHLLFRLYKSNNTPNLPPIAFHLVVEGDPLERIRFLPTEAKIIEVADRTTGQRIADWLNEQGLTGALPAQIALGVGEPANKVRARLTELVKRGGVSKRDGRYYGVDNQEELPSAF